MTCKFCGSDDEGCFEDCNCIRCQDPEGYDEWKDNNPEAYEEWLESQED